MMLDSQLLETIICLRQKVSKGQVSRSSRRYVRLDSSFVPKENVSRN
jgi:hypothetical protein